RQKIEDIGTRRRDERDARKAEQQPAIERRHDRWSSELDRHRRRFAAADAKRRDAALLAVLAKRADQRDDDARTRRADRMTDGARAAVDVDTLVRNGVFLHRRHRPAGERLVYLAQDDMLPA